MNLLPSVLQQTVSKSLVGLALVGSVMFLTPTTVFATADDASTTTTTTTTTASIAACIKNPNGAATNCISTKNVKQLDLYSPPWTFYDETSSEEVIARIKGVVAADPYLELKSITTTNKNPFGFI